jgi:hypothetical protein
MEFHNLEFEDCIRVPLQPAIVETFLRVANAAAGVVAMHCKVGLGVGLPVGLSPTLWQSCPARQCQWDSDRRLRSRRSVPAAVARHGFTALEAMG